MAGGPSFEGMRHKAVCKVIVDGQDMTDRWSPYLLSVQVMLTEDSELATADIELSDRHGVLKLPEIGRTVQIELGWGTSIKTFEGPIDSRRSHGQRSNGRRLSVHAKSVSLTEPVKQPQRDTIGEGEKPDGEMDKKKFEEAVQKFAKEAGFQVEIGKEIGQIERPSWSITGESFMSWGKRISREIGANFVMEGKKGYFSKLGESSNAKGEQLSGIEARWARDGNLKAWDIEPASGRPTWKDTNASFFDRLEGARKWANSQSENQQQGQKLDGKAGWFTLFEAFTKEQAEQQSKSDSTNAQHQQGNGWVVIKGEPRAQPSATVTVKGIRDGVDGEYKIRTVTHTYKRGGGFETLMDILEASTQGDTRGDNVTVAP
jgi:phage protein D